MILLMTVEQRAYTGSAEGAAAATSAPAAGGAAPRDSVSVLFTLHSCSRFPCCFSFFFFFSRKLVPGRASCETWIADNC